MKNLIEKILIVSALIVFCISMILVSEYHNRIVALQKEKDELVVTLEEKSATEGDTEPTRYDMASEIYNVDKYLLESIERLETGHYTSEVFKTNNNTYGGKVNDEYLSYDSAEQSTMELARLLRFSYYDKGITDLYEIGKIYCPDDEEWAYKVMSIYQELKKGN